ncbi:uncharacterized protein LOC135388309 isoform X2 [Ornithodoros turicata]
MVLVPNDDMSPRKSASMKTTTTRKAASTVTSTAQTTEEETEELSREATSLTPDSTLTTEATTQTPERTKSGASQTPASSTDVPKTTTTIASTAHTTEEEIEELPRVTTENRTLPRESTTQTPNRTKTAVPQTSLSSTHSSSMKVSLKSSTSISMSGRPSGTVPGRTSTFTKSTSRPTATLQTHTMSSSSALTGSNMSLSQSSQMSTKSRVLTGISPARVTPPITDDGGKKLLLCTVGRYGNSSQMFPPDGTCDILFYTHVSIADGRLAPATSETWTTFQQEARQANRTRYGVSVNVTSAVSAHKELMTPTGQRILQSLWKDNIRHHGILNAAGSDDFEGLLKALRTFQMKMSPAPLLVLGIKLKNEKQGPATLMKMTSVLPIDILVVLVHQSSWNTAEDYSTSGATMWRNINDIGEPSLSSTIPLVNAAAVPRNITVMFSFTMAVSRFAMPVGWNRTQSVTFGRWKPLAYSEVDYSTT